MLSFNDIENLAILSYVEIKEIAFLSLFLLNHLFDLILSFCFGLTKSIILFIKHSWILYTSMIDIIIKSHNMVCDIFIILMKILVVFKNVINILLKIIELIRVIIFIVFISLNKEKQVKKI